MRHRVSGRKFGREKAHRDLMLKNLVVSLLDHGRINTTVAKAKEIRGLTERVITYGKKGTLHHRRLAFRVLQNKTLLKRSLMKSHLAIQIEKVATQEFLKMDTAVAIARQWLLSSL